MLKKTFRFVRSLHLFFISMALLAGISAIGITVPQGKSISEYASMFGHTLSHVIISARLNTVFSSLWFTIPLGVFCCNLLSCIIHRLITLAKAKKALGSFIVHSGVLFLIIGGIVQYFFNAKQNIIISEGTTEHIAPHNLDITLDTFSIIATSENKSINYVSQLSIFDIVNNTHIHSVTMVNKPLTYKNLHFYQNSFGALPNRIKKVHSVVLSPESDTIFSDSIPFKKRIPISNTNLSIVCNGFLCDFYLDLNTRRVTSRSHQHNNPAFHYSLFENDSLIASYWNFMNNKKVNFEFGPYTIITESYIPSYYSGIQVRKQTGMFWIWLGFLCTSAGLLIVFIVPTFSITQNDTTTTDSIIPGD